MAYVNVDVNIDVEDIISSIDSDILLKEVNYRGLDVEVDVEVNHPIKAIRQILGLSEMSSKKEMLDKLAELLDDNCIK
ncbi:hypothetical protein FACS1894156_8910 [Bacteroidia bacterium]|nr:hypothetical protein FACS1894156_8910 [Bacteroidia bacterium]